MIGHHHTLTRRRERKDGGIEKKSHQRPTTALPHIQAAPLDRGHQCASNAVTKCGV